MTSKSNSIAMLAAASALLVLSACAKTSQPDQPVAAPTQLKAATTESAPTSTHNGLHAYIDPATGQLREPTPEELAAEAAQKAKEQVQRKQAAAAAGQSESAMHEVVLPNGAVEVPLNPAMQHEMEGCVRQDGSTAMGEECSEKSSAADGAKQ